MRKRVTNENQKKNAKTEDTRNTYQTNANELQNTKLVAHARIVRRASLVMNTWIT